VVVQQPKLITIPERVWVDVGELAEPQPGPALPEPAVPAGAPGCEGSPCYSGEQLLQIIDLLSKDRDDAKAQLRAIDQVMRAPRQ
jgi:hypothetical protein